MTDLSPTRNLEPANGAPRHEFSRIWTLNNPVLVSAGRFRDLKAAPQDVEIEAIEPVERVPRGLQAAALLPAAGDKQP